MSRFTLPRDIYYGPGALDELKVLAGHKKAMIFTGGSSMRRGGFLQKTEEVLKAAGLETALFEGIEPDPSIETVMKGPQAMREFEPDVIVAIGGGSPIDAAKAMWVFYEHPDKTFEDIKTPFTMPKLRNKAIFVAIPSTSGTASEVTAFSVITDYSSGIKYPLADFEFIREKYKALGLTPDTTYLFIRGHNVYDMISCISKEVCKVLLKKARRGHHSREAIAALYRDRNSVDIELRQNIHYGAYTAIQKLEEDIGELLGKAEDFVPRQGTKKAMSVDHRNS